MASPAAERMRRHRQRQRDGLRCLTIELYEKEVDALIQRGLLKAETRNDSFEVIEALYQHLKHKLVSCRDA
jgi:SOS response regulatory protein OraA/RecX